VPRRGEHHRTSVAGNGNRPRLRFPLGRVHHGGGIGRHRYQVAKKAEGNLSFGNGSRAGCLVRTQIFDNRLVAAEACHERTIHGPVQLGWLTLQLGAKPYRGPPHQLNHGASRVDCIQRSIRTERGITDVLEVGPDSSGVEVESHDIVLAIEHEHQALLRIRSERPSNGGQLVGRLPRGRVQFGDTVELRQAALSRNPQNADTRHPAGGRRCVVNGQFRASTAGQSRSRGCRCQQNGYGVHGWKIVGQRGRAGVGETVTLRSEATRGPELELSSGPLAALRVTPFLAFSAL
jgi:hypothetical protein